MALKLKYTDEHGIVHINMSPTTSPRDEGPQDPKFDSINSRFGACDLFGGKYECGGEPPSLFRSRYNSVEEELANTPYAFASTLRAADSLDVTLHRDLPLASPLASPRASPRASPQDIEDERFFSRRLSVEYAAPSFTVTQLIHAQDRYYDLSARAQPTPKVGDDAFTVLSDVKAEPSAAVPVVPISKRKKEKSFAIVAEAPPPPSRAASPKSLPPDIRRGRVRPFKGRGFRSETSRHTTPRTSAANSRANSPPRRRTSSLSSLDNMATAALPLPTPLALPRDFVRENIDEIRGISEINREKNQAEAEKKKIAEEEAIFKEMGLSDKEAKLEAIKSVHASRNNSRSNSPGKMTIHIRSRSNSPSVNDKVFINKHDGLPQPTTHRSRVRTVSKSTPQSKDGSPKHSKIPTRQNSVSPARKQTSTSKRPTENNLRRNSKYMSNSTSSLHESIKIGSQVHDKRTMSKSVQHLNIAPALIKGKPPISPGKGGPPPSNKAINAKRLSPIVGTPNKSPTEDPKTATKVTSKPSTLNKKPVKAGTTLASKTNSKTVSKAPSRAASRDPSPDKKKTQRVVTKPPVSRTSSTRSLTKPGSGKPDAKKPMSRSESIKSLSRTSSTKTLNGKGSIKKSDSKKDLTNSNSSINEVGMTKDSKKQNSMTDSATDPEEIITHDIETQSDKISNVKGDIVLMTKKNIISMTTAAITSQPLEVVTAVTNKLPTALEKARERAIFERNSSRESLNGNDKENKNNVKIVDEKKKGRSGNVLSEDNIKLKPLQPPYNDPQLERVKQKIDDILKTPEISRENILNASAKSRDNKMKNLVGKTKVASAFSDSKEPKEMKENKKAESDVKPDSKTKEDIEIRTEATKIVESIMTPVEEPKIEPKKQETKKDIEPIVMVVNERKKAEPEVSEKVNETLVKGEAEVEVQSCNMSSPGADKMAANNKMADGNSDKSHSNGGFPQSTSTTPKPPARTRKEQKEKEKQKETERDTSQDGAAKEDQKKPNICSRLMGKCKTKCCPCCVKGEDESEKETEDVKDAKKMEGKQGMMSKFSCCKKKVEEEVERSAERAAGKGATIEFEDETKRKRKLRDILCPCGRRRRVGDAGVPAQRMGDASQPGGHVVGDTGCCGKRAPQRRDSILSDRPPGNWCSKHLCTWLRGACRRRDPAASRRASMFSKNKSLSPTLPPEDTRKKLDPALIEHTSMIRAAIPILPIVLAYFCLICNIVVPGLGSIFSGLFCLCFGIPRFGVYDQAKHRIGSFVTNLLVGCLQLFTVLFCLVGWGWSIWWGVIMIKISRKYRKLKAEAEAAAAEEEAAPPVTANNHTRA